MALANQVEPVGRLTGSLAPNSLFAKSILIEDGDVITIIPEGNSHSSWPGSSANNCCLQ